MRRKPWRKNSNTDMDEDVMIVMGMQGIESLASRKLREKLGLKKGVQPPAGATLPREAYYRQAGNGSKRDPGLKGPSRWWESYDKVVAAGSIDELDAKIDSHVETFANRYWEMKEKHFFVIPVLADAKVARTVNTKGETFSFHLQLRMTLSEEIKP